MAILRRRHGTSDYGTRRKRQSEGGDEWPGYGEGFAAVAARVGPAVGVALETEIPERAGDRAC